MKNKFIIFISILSLVFTACNQDAKMKTYEGESNLVSFSSGALTYGITEQDNNSIKVAIYRGSSSGELTVPITITAAEDAYKNTFTVSNAKFANGETVGYAVISYGDINKLDPATVYELTLKISDATLMSPSNQTSIVVNAQRVLTYKAIGNSKFTSAFWEESSDKVVTEKAEEAEFYRFKSPYKALAGTEEFQEGNDLVVSIVGGKVVCANTNIGWKYDADNGFVYLMPKLAKCTLVGKKLTIVASFGFPSTGLAFNGEYAEEFILP